MKASRVILLALALIIAVTKWRKVPATSEVAASNAPSRAASAEPNEVAVATPYARAAARTVASAEPAPLVRDADFARYHDLARKVFSNDEETEARARLVHDADLLLEAGRVLVRRDVSPAVLARQNEALALLLESVRSGDEVGVRALIGVIHDGAIEDQTLARDARVNLAGIKAEAMYSWSAANPRASAQIEAALPGEVSRRIWANARARQQANVAEGQTVGMGARVATGMTSDDAQ